MVLSAGVVYAQNYPNTFIRIVTTQAGSGNDFTARVIAPAISGGLGQQVIVDNRGAIAGEVVAKAQPDGYTLLCWGSPLWLAPFLREKVAYDPVKDFAPISLLVTTPNILVVHPSLSVKSVKELIALAKARPGDLNYASPGAGGSVHLAAELFKSMAGVNIVQIGYRGTGQAFTSLISGEVQLMFPNAASVTPHVKSGRLRALAVTSAVPSALAPGLPTVTASGVPGYESLARFGMFAPAKTPEAVVRRLNQEIVRALNMADVKQKLFNSGAEVVGSSPEEFGTTIKSEMARLGKVIKDAGIRAE